MQCGELPLTEQAHKAVSSEADQNNYHSSSSTFVTFN